MPIDCVPEWDLEDAPVANKAETLTLLYDRLAVRVDNNEKWANSNIYKPDISMNDEDRPRGTVVAVGPGGTNDDGVKVDMNIRVGDRIILQKYGAQTIEINGEKLLVTGQKQVIAILNR